MAFKNIFLNDDQEYAFNYIKCTNCKRYQLTMAVHSITANLSGPPAGQAHPYESRLGQRRGLQLGVQFSGVLTKLIRPKSCPQGFLLLGRATKLWGFPSEVSLIFAQSLQQTERCLSSEGCVSRFWWEQIAEGRNTNRAAAGFSSAPSKPTPHRRAKTT